VSDFVHNLARRGAGLDPVATVRPPFVPYFAPGLPTRVWRPAPSLVEGMRETREAPPPAASLQPAVPEPDREAGQEMKPARVSASEQLSSPAVSPLPPQPPAPDPEPPSVPPPAHDRRKDGQPAPRHSESLPAGPANPPRDISPPLREAQEEHVPTIRARAARLTVVGSEAKPADEMPPGSPIGSSPEARAAVEPGRAPGTQSPSPGSGGSPQIRVASSEEVTERYLPAVRTTAARQPEAGQTTRGSGPAAVGTKVVETTVVEASKSDGPTHRGEPAAGVEPDPVHPPSGEPAATGQPAPLAQATPTPVASPVRQASVIRPEPAHPAVLPPLLQRANTPPERESIHVRIGTVEVRATTPPPASPPAPQHQGFDDYAMIRSYMGWERG
jgi:hypothetical protein